MDRRCVSFDPAGSAGLCSVLRAISSQYLGWILDHHRGDGDFRGGYVATCQGGIEAFAGGDSALRMNGEWDYSVGWAWTGQTALACHLLLEQAQRRTGRIGVHPSARIQQGTRPKLLENRKLAVFQNGALLLRFRGGSAPAEKGNDWAKLRRCSILT